MRQKKGIVGKVEIFQRLGNDDVPFFWRMRAHNGEILATSEGYDKADDRDDTAEALAKQLGVRVTQETESECFFP